MGGVATLCYPPLAHPRPLVIPLPDDGWSLTWFYNMMEIFFVLLWFSFPSWPPVLTWSSTGQHLLILTPRSLWGLGTGVLSVLWSRYHTLTQISRWIELWSPASDSLPSAVPPPLCFGH